MLCVHSRPWCVYVYMYSCVACRKIILISFQFLPNFVHWLFPLYHFDASVEDSWPELQDFRVISDKISSYFHHYLLACFIYIYIYFIRSLWINCSYNNLNIGHHSFSIALNTPVRLWLLRFFSLNANRTLKAEFQQCPFRQFRFGLNHWTFNVMKRLSGHRCVIFISRLLI